MSDMRQKILDYIVDCIEGRISLSDATDEIEKLIAASDRRWQAAEAFIDYHIGCEDELYLPTDEVYNTFNEWQQSIHDYNEVVK